ncbi:TPA: SDR family oxidoreductase [Streptococcus agalactiae]
MIKAALTKGHKLAYLSRHEGKGDIFKDPRLTYIKGDITEADKIHLEDRTFDILIDCIGAIKPNQLDELNVKATQKAVALCHKNQIPKLVYISANSGYSAYIRSKRKAEQIIKASGLDYLFVRPGLMYGEERPLSIFQAKCIKLFSHLPFLGIVVQKVFPTKVVIVAEAIVTTLRTKPTQKILSIEELNNK